MAMILDIADALVTALNAHDFTLDFTAVRIYRPEFNLSADDGMYVPVMPQAIESELVSRAKDTEDMDRILVGVAKKVANIEAITLDPLMGLVEEIGDFCKGLTLGTTPRAVCVLMSNEPIFNPDMLKEMRTFQSILTLSFKLWR